MNSQCIQDGAGAALALALAGGAPCGGAGRAAVDLPPSADLTYAIQAAAKGLRAGRRGERQLARRRRQVHAGRASRARPCSARSSRTAAKARSTSYGLAPEKFYRKAHPQGPVHHHLRPRRRRRSRFTEDKKSATRSRAASRTAPACRGSWRRWRAPRRRNSSPGSEWRMVVAGRRDAEPWALQGGQQAKSCAPAMGQRRRGPPGQGAVARRRRSRRSTSGWRRRTSGIRSRCASATTTATMSSNKRLAKITKK